MTRTGRILLCAASLMLLRPAVAAIYSCVDASGRRITSDRPITECMDREQKILNPSGTLRETVPPTPTGVERATIEEKTRLEALERQRLIDEQNRLRALSVRYPTLSALERDRAASLAPIDAVITAGRQRLTTLEAQRRRVLADTSATPQALEQVDEQLAAQQRFVASKLAEREAVVIRFANIQRQLEGLWSRPAPEAPR